MKLFDNEDDCYYPSFYNIYINSSKTNLSELIGSDKEPELFHEYIHFIQDITTTFGLVNTSCIMNKIKDVYELKNELLQKGITELNLPVNAVSHPATNINVLLFKYYLQYTETEDFEGETLAYEPEKIEDIINLPDGTTITVPHYDIMSNEMHKYKFGTHAIMEGICHCLQKEIYGISEPTLQVPYNLSKLIWDFMLPEEKNNIKAFLDVSEVSLMHLMSAKAFIDTIKQIQWGKVKIDSNFYQTICNLWETNQKRDIYSNFDYCYTEMARDVSGTLVADLYYCFNEWLFREMRIGYDWRFTKEPIFSSFLEKKQLSAKERSNWLMTMFLEYGFPPILNAEGLVFCHQKKDFLSNISSLSTIVMASAYDCIAKTHFNGCPLKDNCIEENQSETILQKFEVDETCDSEPWNKNPNNCPFAAVWNTWGLKKLTCKRNT